MRGVNVPLKCVLLLLNSILPFLKWTEMKYINIIVGGKGQINEHEEIWAMHPELDIQRVYENNSKRIRTVWWPVVHCKKRKP